MDTRLVAILWATFVFIMASGCASQTRQEIELARLARTCKKGDGFTRAIRAYIKTNGAQASIPYLIQSFENSCSACPRRAQLILVEIGAPTVPALIAATQSRKPDVFGTLPKTFAMLDPEITMPPLSAVLHDSAAPHREELLELVIYLESKAKGTIPALLWILEEDPRASVDLQRSAAEALCAIGPEAATAGPAVIRLLKDVKLPKEQRPSRRRSTPDRNPHRFHAHGSDPSLAALGKLGVDSEGVLDYLLEQIAGPEKDSALDAIALMGPAAKRARPALRETLKAIPPHVRPRCYCALCKTGEPFETVLPFLVKDLNDQDVRTQIAALHAVRNIGPAARSVFPEVLKATIGDNRLTALETLPAIQPPAEHVIPHLIDLMNNNDPTNLYDVLRCLEKLGVDANPAIPRIVELLAEKTWRRRGNTHHDPRTAATALQKMGTPPTAAIPGLIVVLSDDDRFVQSISCELLGRLGKSAHEAVPTLRELLAIPPSMTDEGDSDDPRDSIAKALFQIQPESETDQDLIARLLDVQDIRTRLRVAAFLWQTPKYKDRCIQELAIALSHERVSIREWAAESLAQIGPAAEAARQALNEALNDDESTVRLPVKAALEKLEN